MGLSTTKRGAASWFLYILRCSDGTLYTGITNDLARRLRQHNKGTASRYTRARLPVAIVHWEPCRGRSRALKKEHAVKRLSRREKEVYIEGKAIHPRPGKRTGTALRSVP